MFPPPNVKIFACKLPVVGFQMAFPLVSNCMAWWLRNTGHGNAKISSPKLGWICLAQSSVPSTGDFSIRRISKPTNRITWKHFQTLNCSFFLFLVSLLCKLKSLPTLAFEKRRSYPNNYRSFSWLPFSTLVLFIYLFVCVYKGST